MDSNLTLEEMEREAYQRGDVERARLLQEAIEAQDPDEDICHECEVRLEQQQEATGQLKLTIGEMADDIQQAIYVIQEKLNQLLEKVG